jgi:hypothetical protein
VAAELDRALTAHRQALLAEMTARDGDWFDAEMDKLDRWAEDRRDSLKAELGPTWMRRSRRPRSRPVSRRRCLRS